MRLKGFAEEKLLDRIRQFGVLAAAKQLLFVLLRPLLRINTDIIFVAPNPKPASTNLFADVRFLTLENSTRESGSMVINFRAGAPT